MEAFASKGSFHGEIKLPDPARCRAEVEAIKQLTLPPDLAYWVEQYETVGSRNPYLWKWALKGVDLTCLPCVEPSLRATNNETKAMGVLLDVLTDDVADTTQDHFFLERLSAATFAGARANTDGLNVQQQHYVELTTSLWQAILNRTKTYPRCEEFRDLLHFDYLQLFNAMRYSALVNHMPYAMNMVEHDVYLPHSMHIIICGTLDLMCSPTFDINELGKVRTLLWDAQYMGRIANLITTWQRELPERDFSSGVFVLAMEQGYLSPGDLRNGDPEELTRCIREHRCEEFFLARREHYRQRVAAMAGQIKSFDVMEVLDGLDALLRIHLVSRGLI